MKKSIFLISGLAISAYLFAGGIVTNTNQCARFTRMQAFDAVIGIEGTYFNPAGLTFLPNDGFYLSINNQTIGQTSIIKSNYALLTGSPETSYEGIVSAPIFPGIYAVYKVGKLAFSGGFNPIGGGGGAEYQDGLPSFEMPVSNLVPSLQSSLTPIDNAILAATNSDPGFRNISGYSYDVYFKGSSVFFGYQANVSYAFNDMFSVSVGGRYVSAKNTYQGHLKDIMVTVPAPYGNQLTAGNYLRFISDQIQQMDSATAVTLDNNAVMLDIITGDKEVDVVEKGSGFTPIIGLDIKLSEKINFAFKYEHNTKLELTTYVNDNKDGNGIYTDGETKRADMPAMVAAGVEIKPIEKIITSVGFHYYFDKNADYGKTTTNDLGEVISLKNEDILNNTIEIALGAQYSLSDKFLVSAGWLHVSTGATEEYQSDLDFDLSSNSFGGGIGYKILPNMELNLAGSYTLYTEGKKDFSNRTTNSLMTTEKYSKNAWVASVGLNIFFGSEK